MLIELDVGGTAPSMEIRKLVSKHDDLHLHKGQKVVYKTERYKVDLKGKENGFYILPLDEGIYQVTQVNAPYFNLPYKLSTNARRDWRFSIKEKHINYVGQLVIEKERGVSFVNVKLENRIAMDLHEITMQTAKLSEQLPLRLGTGVRDDFYKELTGE
jgi:hypothetical protein